MLVINSLINNKKTINFFPKNGKNNEMLDKEEIKEKINKEIIDFFIKKYKKKKENKTENPDDDQSNFLISDIKFNPVNSNDYNMEFNLIIKEEMKIYFVNKLIEIKVKGILYFGKYPKFFFNFKNYKLSLTDEVIKIKKEEEKKKESENKNEKKNNQEKKEEYIIFQYEGKENDNDSFVIGMQPKYRMTNPEFKNLFLDYGKDLNVDDTNNKMIKGPQEEIMEYISDLLDIIKYEKND